MPKLPSTKPPATLLLFLSIMLLPLFAYAHHGWGWATGEEFEISGTIIEKRLGNPHGELVIESNGERWTIEIGQPWRNSRVGLTEDKLGNGVEIKVHGHRSKKADENLVKAERVEIDGVNYNLYPGRASD